jgi:cysteinyl-tRNA synthetase
MESTLKIYNSLSREKEVFKPINEGQVGMYVCGPTVYSDVHLGNCRTFTSFDVIFRYLKYLGYKVRYVRNITDVGHLEGDNDDISAEDKISKRARLEKLEPMEIVQHYTNGFHAMMRTFNNQPPNIEPRATGHILEQINMVKAILKNGYAYESNGSVYFDTVKFARENDIYGKLSGRVIDDLLAESRDDLKNQEEKRHPSDFAIWIKADPKHIMRWESEWSEGFPGWHLECSAMSTKYLGKTFDIHGGGNDLKFPHHENEVAQNYSACHCAPANYWMHGNMLLLNGRKMAKSDGNTITPQQLFSGESPHISKGYSPMVVRFFMLQSHYRSTLDLTDEALQAAEKGYRRLMEGNKLLQEMQHPGGGQASELDEELRRMMEQVKVEMDDDFNTPKALAALFELVTKINSLKAGHLSLSEVSEETLHRLKQTFHDYIYEVLGLKDENAASGSKDNGTLEGVMDLIIEIRQEARARKDFDTSDKIRDALKELDIVLKDGKEGTTWTKA